MPENVGVVDFRARPVIVDGPGLWTTPETTERMRQMGVTIGPPLTIDGFVAAMDAAGVDICVYPGRVPLHGEAIPNAHVLTCIRAYPDRFVGLAAVDPTSAGPAVLFGEIDSAVEAGMSGIVMDPTLSGLAIDHGLLLPIYRHCAEHGITVLVASGGQVGALDDYLRVDRVGAAFPDLRLVVAHAVWPGTDFWLAVAERHANVYLDVSMFNEKPGVAARLAESADGFVGGKLIWGSAFPMKPLDSYRKFALAGFTDEQFGKITRENALRALGRLA